MDMTAATCQNGLLLTNRDKGSTPRKHFGRGTLSLLNKSHTGRHTAKQGAIFAVHMDMP